MIRGGHVAIAYFRPADLSVDETLYEVRETIARMQAKCVVVDSLQHLQTRSAQTGKSQ